MSIQTSSDLWFSYLVMSHIPNLVLHHHLSPQFQTTFLQRSVYRVNLCLCCAAFRGFFFHVGKNWVSERWSSYLRCRQCFGQSCSCRDGWPCRVYLSFSKGHLSLSLSIYLSLALWPFILGQLWHLLQTDNIRTSVNQKHVCIVNIFNGLPLPGFWLNSVSLLSVADPSWIHARRRKTLFDTNCIIN